MDVHIEQDGPVTIISISRPKIRNAVNPATAEALRGAFLDFEANSEARVAVLMGEGGAFCAGYDLKQVGEMPENILDRYNFLPGNRGDSNAKKPDAGQYEEVPGGPMGPSRLRLDKPVIAAIEGPAVAGGMELALWCDLRVMAENSYMGVYCRRWGVPLVDGGTVRLPRMVGMGRAMDLILTGRKVEAEECHRIGLCERIAPPGMAREIAVELAKEIARFPQKCLRADRRSAYAQWDLELEQALRVEWRSKSVFVEESRSGAARFASGKGRGGDFQEI